MLKCAAEHYKEKLEAQKNEGCNMHGLLHVNKVAGNIHFAPGKSYTQGSMHAHDLHEYVKDHTKFTWTHRIHELSFGNHLVTNPLDNIEKISTQGWSNYQYYIKVVRTDFIYLNSTEVTTHQYSVTEHESISPPIMGTPVAMPGVFFSIDISPMVIKYSEYRKPFSHLLTDLCAIIGGVYTVAGIVDGLIYSAEQRFRKKLEIGKGH
jgi:hypothetical protein